MSARREVMASGFYDRSIIGGGDRIMLGALQQRWLAGTGPYTAAGPVLLAVNPLEPQPGLSPCYWLNARALDVCRVFSF